MIERDIAPGVHRIVIPMSAELSTSIVVLDAERPVLIDAGTAAGGFAAVSAAIREGAFRPPRAVLCTHFHHDHTGSLPAMRDHWNVEVYAHIAETGLICHPEAFAEALSLNGITAAPPAAEGVEVTGVLDGFGLTVGGRKWEAVHVPGHSWGHLAFWSPEERLLVAGDAVQGRGVPYRGVPGQGTGLPYYLDANAYRCSLERMRALHPSILVLAHELPGFATPVITDSHTIARVFEDSVRVVDELDALIQCASESGGSLDEIGVRVARALALPQMTPQAVLTVRAHLVAQRIRTN